MDSSPKLWPKIKKDHEKNTHGNGNAKFKSPSLRTQRNTVDFDFFIYLFIFYPLQTIGAAYVAKKMTVGKKYVTLGIWVSRSLS